MIERTSASALGSGRAARREGTAPTQRENWLAGQNEAFRAAIDGAPLERSLDILISTAIVQVSGTKACAFYIANEEGTELRHVAGMPDPHSRQVDGSEIGSDSLPSSLAISLAEPIIIADIREEQRWHAWLRLAEEAGYVGFWSFPVETTGGKAVGTFAMFFEQPRSPTPDDLHFAKSMCSTAAIIIAQHQNHSELRESEARYRDLFNSIDEGFCTIEVQFDDAGHAFDYLFLETNPAFERQTGLKDAVGRTMRELSPDHEKHWFDIYGDIALTGEPKRFQRPAEALGHWYDVYAFRVGTPEQRRVAVLFNDVTERRLTESRQRVLLAELQHRVRNTLAIIRSIVRRTALSSTSVEDFEQHLDGRLGSFARTQAYVTRHPDRGVDLELIVRDEMLAHATDGSQQVRIEGPQVRLSANQAQTFGLAVHELTSNAIKHGALASDGNRVDVKWLLKGKGGRQRLRFSWHEWLGREELEEPQHTGFGTELLNRVLRYELDAEPVLEFRPDGFRYEVEFPLVQE